MVKFLKIQYQLRRIGEDQLDQLVRRGTITEFDKQEIMDIE